MGKGEIACYEQFLLFPQCFQKACFPGASKGVILWERVKRRDCVVQLNMCFMLVFQITNIIQWLGHEFMQIRLNQKEAVTFGLYPKWRRYVPHLADLLRDLSKCLVHKMVPTLVEATTNQSECLKSVMFYITNLPLMYFCIISVSQMINFRLFQRQTVCRRQFLTSVL